MTIYVATLKKIFYRTSFIDESLIDFIDGMRNGHHRSQVEQIRNEPDVIKNRKLKKQLPVMYPAYYGSPTDPKITGIIQFDIDIKRNVNFNSSEGRKIIIGEIPELAYAAISPNYGLKFGLLTDLSRDDGETRKIFKKRYEIGYKILHEKILGILPAIYDHTVGYMSAGCFMTHDEDAFCYNNLKYKIEINELTKELSRQPTNKKSKFPASAPGSGSVSREQGIFSTDEEIISMLSHIPRDLDYAERLKINLAIISAFGEEEGGKLLVNHWDKPESEQEKLQQDIAKQANYLKNHKDDPMDQAYGSIGYLYKMARAHGYIQVTGAKRHTYHATQSKTDVKPLISAKEAEDIVSGIIKKFVEDGESLFLNITAGFGKTNIIIQEIITAAAKLKYEILVPNHTLADQIYDKINELLGVANPLNQKARHIKGKSHKDSHGNTMCQNVIILKAYMDAGIVMPASVCTKECFMKGKCNYTEQFADETDNIRIMVHQELNNPASAWSGGIEQSDIIDGWLPKEIKWLPDRVIIDESYCKINNHPENCNSHHIVIRNIINDLIQKKTLEEAIEGREQDIIDSYFAMRTAADIRIHFTNTQTYISDIKKIKTCPWSEVLNTLYDYTSQGKNPNELLKLKFSSFEETLYCPKLDAIEKRYDCVPKLFLDATANEDVIKKILGNINFVSLKIKSKNDVNTYQLENANFSKSRLEDKIQVANLIKYLQKLRAKYGKVGVITYLNTKNIKNFDAYMAEKLDAEEYAHFGNLRGLNNFENLDCIFIIGRHMLPPLEIELRKMAIYSQPPHDNESFYSDVPVLMKDGSVWALNNIIYQDSKMNCTKQHFSNSENIQALGRSRYIFGKKKDIYIFSNESLGTDVEITGFFRYEEPKYNQAIEELKKIGQVRNIESGLKQLGLTEYAIKKCRKIIDSEFLEAGVSKKIIEGKDKAGRRTFHEYYCIDDSLSRDIASENISE